MTSRTLKESLAGRRNSPAASHRPTPPTLNAGPGDSNENLDLFSENRRAALPVTPSHVSSDVPVKSGRHSLEPAKVAKGGVDDSPFPPPEAPVGTQSRSVLAARKTTLKGRSASTTRAVPRPSVSQTESNPSPRPSRSSSATRPSISASPNSTFSTGRSSSALKATSATVSFYTSPSSPLNASLSAARSSTPSSRPTLSRASTPSRVRSALTTNSHEKTRSAPNSRSSSPSSRPQIAEISIATSARSSSRSSTPSHRPAMPSASVTSGSSGVRVLSNGHRAVSASLPSSAGPRLRATQKPTVSPDSPPQTPTRLKAAFTGRAVSAGRSRLGVAVTSKGSPGNSGTIRSQKRNPSPVVTRGWPMEPSGRNNGRHTADKPDSEKALHVSDITGRKPAKSDSTGFGRTVSRTSLETAIKQMDIRNGKVGTRPVSSTTLYPHSIRSPTCRIRSVMGSSGSESTNNDHEQEPEKESNSSRSLEKETEEEDRRSLAKLGKANMYGSARYDALLFKEDADDTKWLLSMDDPSEQGLVFDNSFEPVPEPFGPL